MASSPKRRALARRSKQLQRAAVSFAAARRRPVLLHPDLEAAIALEDAAVKFAHAKMECLVDERADDRGPT